MRESASISFGSLCCGGICIHTHDNLYNINWYIFGYMIFLLRSVCRSTCGPIGYECLCTAKLCCIRMICVLVESVFVDFIGCVTLCLVRTQGAFIFLWASLSMTVINFSLFFLIELDVTIEFDRRNWFGISKTVIALISVLAKALFDPLVTLITCAMDDTNRYPRLMHTFEEEEHIKIQFDSNCSFSHNVRIRFYCPCSFCVGAFPSDSIKLTFSILASFHFSIRWSKQVAN